MAPGKAIQLAEVGEWDALELLIEIDPSQAREFDHFGMLPLHWCCTDEAIPIDVFQTVLHAYPEAAHTKNNSHMLPLHIAIQNNLSKQHVECLVKTYPDATYEKTKTGSTPLDLADKNGNQTLDEYRETTDLEELLPSMSELVSELKQVKTLMLRNTEQNNNDELYGNLLQILSDVMLRCNKIEESINFC